MSPETVEFVITAADEDWLGGFVSALVADRIIACGNVAGPIRSIYRWQGEIEDQTEFRATLHTRTSHVPLIVERADREHPYEVPCVIATPITAGNPAYLAWVLAETAAALDSGSTVVVP